jgi:TonB family protein
MSAPVLVRPGTARPAVPVPVPASTLSKQLGSSSIPAYSSLPDDDATTDGRKYPRLLRRRTSGGGNNLVAELRTPAATNLSSGNSAVIPVGVVRPTSLGIMAGNLLYSPTPAYPVAAAAAHVQGEVKVQAEIDRDGNVVAARVVSGPPMLRDAAVDAIQHWRYKPWTAGGKPVATSALAVVDFQLP